MGLDALGKMTPTQTMKIPKEAIAGQIPGIASALFTIMNQPGYPENEHLMRCVTRLVALGGPAVVPIARDILSEITKTLTRVCAVFASSFALRAGAYLSCRFPRIPPNPSSTTTCLKHWLLCCGPSVAVTRQRKSWINLRPFWFLRSGCASARCSSCPSAMPVCLCAYVLSAGYPHTRRGGICVVRVPAVCAAVDVTADRSRCC